MSWLTCFGDLDRFLHTISPTFEKTLSDGQLVAGIHKYFLINRNRFGNRNLLFLHQSRISSFSITDSLKYASISLLQSSAKSFVGLSNC